MRATSSAGAARPVAKPSDDPAPGAIEQGRLVEKALCDGPVQL
jgi:hypothetical protein